jgi:hypothetical protein
MSSVLNSFSQNFNKWFVDVALPVVSKYVTETKNCPTSVEELEKLFNLPTSQVVPFPAMNGAMPNITGAKPAAPATSAATGTGTRGRKKQESADGATCIYKLTKGARPDQPCGKNVFAYGYCKACLSKGNAKEDLGKRGITPEMIEKAKKGDAPAATASSGINTLATTGKPTFVPGIANTGAPFVPGVANTGQVEIPNLRELDPVNKIYLMENLFKNGLFKKIDNGGYVCIGALRQDKQNAISPLTPDELKYVESIGYKYIDVGNQNGAGNSNGNGAGNVVQPVQHVQHVAQPVASQVPPPVQVPPVMNTGLNTGFNPQLPPGMLMPPGMMMPGNMMLGGGMPNNMTAPPGMVMPPTLLGGNFMNRTLPPQVTVGALPEGNI